MASAAFQRFCVSEAFSPRSCDTNFSCDSSPTLRRKSASSADFRSDQLGHSAHIRKARGKKRNHCAHKRLPFLEAGQKRADRQIVKVPPDAEGDNSRREGCRHRIVSDEYWRERTSLSHLPVVVEGGSRHDAPSTAAAAVTSELVYRMRRRL